MRFCLVVAVVTMMCFLGFPLRAEAQLPLVEATVGVLDGPSAFALADLNREDRLDAVTTSGPDGTVGEIPGGHLIPKNGWSAEPSIDGVA